MKMLNIFKGKKQKNNEKLLKEYEEGRILQVDNKIDNKEYFKKLDDNDKLKQPEREDN